MQENLELADRIGQLLKSGSSAEEGSSGDSDSSCNGKGPGRPTSANSLQSAHTRAIEFLEFLMGEAYNAMLCGGHVHAEKEADALKKRCGIQSF